MTALADWLIDLIESVPSWAVYLVAAGVIYAETATVIVGMIMPSEAVLLAAGVATGVGSTSLVGLLVLVVIAAIAGDTTGYWIGRSSGQAVLSSGIGRKVGARRLVHARVKIDRRGTVAVATARWVGFVRSIVPPMAGTTRMSFPRFLGADIVGATTWVTAVLLVGYFAGAALGASILLYAVIGLLAAAALWYLGRWLITRRRDARSALPATSR